MRSSRERGALSPSRETQWHSCKLGGKAAQMSSWGSIGLLFAGAMAGLINTLAGGGPVLTLMALTLFGLDPRLANLTSTVALIPGQLRPGQSLKCRERDGIALRRPDGADFGSRGGGTSERRRCIVIDEQRSHGAKSARPCGVGL